MKVANSAFYQDTVSVQKAETAIALQQRLSSYVWCEDRLPQPLQTVAGVDVGFQDNHTITQAAVVVLRFPQLEKIDEALARSPTTFPYIPGLLSFREIPAIIQALENLHTPPDLIICDGQGIAHPRRLGIASHLGLLMDQPTIGVAKSRLIGHHQPVPTQKGAWQPLWDQGEQIGAVLRSRTNVKPVYVSLGHRISLSSALELTLACTPKYRLPETTRQADKLASNKQ